MAKQTTLNPYFLGTDFAYVFHIQNAAETASIDIAGWALSFMLKNRQTDADLSALLTKTTAAGTVSISGAFNATPATNTQRATVTIADTDTDALATGVKHWELKRTDAGLEAILAYGSVELRRGVHRT